MARRTRDHFKFWLERFLLRGPQYRLLFIAAVIGLLSVAAGILVLPSGTFDSLPEAVWWAFLRLSDPGYLGDDEGLFIRAVSTGLTVSGYVVFLGSLVAIMTQWLNSTMARLESGLTPVTRTDHVLILGWNNRTVPVVEELLRSEERVRRFLRHHGARSLQIVILAEEVTPALRQDLREQLGELWDERRITLRTGSSLRTEHLERGDFRNAAVILIPGTDFGAGGSVNLDARTIKALLSIDAASMGKGGGLAGHRDSAPPRGAKSSEDDRPYVVAEIFDSRKRALAKRAYGGPLELVSSDAAIARLLAQNLRHPGLSHVYNELLSNGEGNEIYLPEAEELVGHPVEDLHAAFPHGVVLGVVRPEGHRIRPHLNPGPGFRVEPGDRIAVMAPSWGDVRGPFRRAPAPLPRGARESPPPHEGTRRILLLGWGHKAPALLRELGTYADQRFEVDVLAQLSPERRESQLNRYGLTDQRVPVRQLEGDYTVHSELLRLDPLSYDGIVLLGSDWLPTGPEADARTILGALLLQEITQKRERRPGILVELLDPENVTLLGRGGLEVVVTPMLVSHILSQVALRRELRAVFDELFTAGGAEVVFRPGQGLGLDGLVGFTDLQRATCARGETLMGIRLTAGPTEGSGEASGEGSGGSGDGAGAGGLFLNPSRDLRWPVEALEVVVLATL
jgi:ion channel POLLUX/CASTOR